MIGLVALGLTASAVHAPAYGRIRSSTQHFRQYFHDLKAGSSLNPVERFVFSLMLANTKDQAKTECPAVTLGPPSRT